MKYIIALCLFLCSASLAWAQKPGSAQVARVNQGTVGVITGMEGGTYARTAADLTLLDDDTLRVLPALGKGSLQNLSDILYLRGIDIGFVQADALAYAKQHGLFPNLTQSLRYIAKLYDEEVHVIARQDIARIEDLEGQRVNVDVAGSGSAMTAEILLDMLGIKAVVEHERQASGVQRLKDGEIAAIIHVGGAPIPLFAGLSAAQGLHLLPVPLTQALAETYLPDRFTHDNYPLLVAEGEAVPTLAVGDVMAVFAWAPNTERYNKVARFVEAFFGRFDEFQRPPRHPKWREVNLTAEVPGWTRFQPAHDWLVRQTTAGTAGQATQASFNAFLTQSGAPANAAAMSEAGKEALFRQFLLWQKQRAPRP
ncbi:TAXI family TRAP transporter solute-binding subunit [Rhodovastum atsumiense]|uniref:TAXI family TRAP transporter solute-binding subunit n=1 Tax=Rhodovastum atsumiense TaxID=504468 RepID=UPI001EF10502|nr:TAXI family TRAP transporter solute-binding subunit [Rhodovastum atsumiense]CAH2602562.1 TAXI family TRAP transporter solute-binding subunit [Rhodovastum atsumiense]